MFCRQQWAISSSSLVSSQSKGREYMKVCHFPVLGSAHRGHLRHSKLSPFASNNGSAAEGTSLQESSHPDHPKVCSSFKASKHTIDCSWWSVAASLTCNRSLITFCCLCSRSKCRPGSVSRDVGQDFVAIICPVHIHSMPASPRS